MSEQYFDERKVDKDLERQSSEQPVIILAQGTPKAMILVLISNALEDEGLTEFTQDFFEEADEAFYESMDERIVLVYIGKLSKLIPVLDKSLEADLRYFKKFEVLLNELLIEIGGKK